MKNFLLSALALMLFVGLSAQDDEKIIIIKKDKGGKWIKEEVKGELFKRDSKAETFMFGQSDNDRLIAQKTNKAFLGVVASNNGRDGFFVSRVVENSGAEAGGLQRGDQVLNINGLPTEGDYGLRGVLAQFNPGDQVTLNILRDGQTQALSVTLGKTQTTKWVLNDERDPCDVFIGVYTTTGRADNEGVRITSIIGNTPAEVSNLRAGDIILELNEVAVNSSRDLRIERDKNEPGDEFTLLIKRNERVMDVLSRFKTCDTELESEVLEVESLDFEVAEEIEVEIEEEVEVVEPMMAEPVTENQPLFNTPDFELELFDYQAFPNPSRGDINIMFKAEPMATTIRLIDVNGKVIYKEQLNNFDGYYQNQLNLGTTPGTLLLTIQQGEKVVSKKLVLLDRN